MTDKVIWDWDELTADEAEDLEEAAQAAVPTIIASIRLGSPTVPMLRAVVWIARRRSEPDLTLEQVRLDYRQYTSLAEAAEEHVEPPEQAEEPVEPSDGEG